MKTSHPTTAICVTLIAIGCFAEERRQHPTNKLAVAGGAPTSPERLEGAGQIMASFRVADPDWKIRMEALVKLLSIGREATPVLADAMLSDSHSTRLAAAHALALLADIDAKPVLERALHDSSAAVRAYAVFGLSLLGEMAFDDDRYRDVLTKDRDRRVRYGMAWAFERDDTQSMAPLIQKLLREYDLSKMDTARLDDPAPEFSLTDAFGQTYRLSDFRGKKNVILRFYREAI